MRAGVHTALMLSFDRSACQVTTHHVKKYTYSLINQTLFFSVKDQLYNKMSQFIIYLSCVLAAMVCQAQCATKTLCTNERVDLRNEVVMSYGELVSSIEFMYMC